MLAGYDANGPQLYQIDPSGTFFAWKASAIGKNMVNAKTFLEKRYADDLELEDAIDTALLTLKESFEGEMSGDNVEVGHQIAASEYCILKVPSRKISPRMLETHTHAG